MSDTQQKLAELTQSVSNYTAEALALNERTSVTVLQTEQDVASAKAEADRSTTQANTSKDEADRSTLQANNSTVEADRAKAEADRATAVVTGGEAAQAPEAGKIPLADSKGHLDSGWTPLLAAMYPYSGVIGSVDKGDLFTFAQISAFSNLFQIKNRQFNIAGKFVQVAAQNIVLPEAESTAERAVAFDDIFLDWHGNIQTYRSITPHRTTTGYDRDDIATEHGYSKVQNGLYQNGGTYALLLGRVARRNKGAYHPVFNPEGACAFATNSNSSGYTTWSSSTAVPCLSTENTFNTSPTGCRSGKWANGAIAAGNDKALRPDNKFYDAIYADDFTPLYYSAKNVIDRQALLFDNFNRAVAGETFSGAEASRVPLDLSEDLSAGEPTITVGGNNIYFNEARGWSTCTVPSLAGTSPTRISLTTNAECTTGALQIQTTVKDASGATKYVHLGTLEEGEAELREIDYEPPEGWVIQSLYFRNNRSTPSTGSFTDISIRVTTGGDTGPARPQFLMTDIIGAEAAWPEQWKTHGLPGNWLSTGEEGEDLIPDGTNKNYKLSRKCLECYQVLRSSDKGVSWENVTATYSGNFEGTSNSVSSDIAASYVWMVFYRTAANPFELANNVAAVFFATDSVLGTYNHSDTAVLTNSLIGKTPIGFRFNIVSLKSHSRWQARFSTGGDTRVPVNDVFPILDNSQAGPTCKMLPYVSTDGYLHFIYKEIKRDLSLGWGDDNKFDVINSQSTATDLNGLEVIVGQKRVELPYHFEGETY